MTQRSALTAKYANAAEKPRAGQPLTPEKEALIVTHLPQVKYIAERIGARLPASVDRDDLVGAGVMGLIDAVEKYDEARGVQFKTYAETRIRGAILDSLREMDWSSRGLRSRAREIEKATRRIEQEKGRMAEEEELAEAMGMGLTAEQVQRKYAVSREDSDAFAFRSHQNALKAQAEGRFDDEIVPLEIQATTMNGGGKPETHKAVFAKDEGPRADTSVEALAKLRPVFHAAGTVTAGNSSQTSDGAAAALIMSEKRAKELGLKPKARFVSFAVGGVPPEIMGIGPVVAIPKALALAGLKLDDIGLIELNEAFAVQALAVARQAGLNLDTLNVNGGAIALGHPLGCTGAKLTATILREMERRNTKYGMVTMCVGGGQGAAGIFERM